VVKTFIKGLRMPTGVGFHNGNLYVIDIDNSTIYPNTRRRNLDARRSRRIRLRRHAALHPARVKYLIPKGGLVLHPVRPAV
jgi:hypothetical protein